jgi:putative ABC transport system permease protein
MKTPRRLAGIWERVVVLFRPGRFEADLDEELRYHLDEATRRHLDRGLSWEDARAAAARQLGSLAATKDAVREETGVRPLHDIWRDVRHAVHLFTRRPALSAIVVFTIAIGIAANSAIFTVVNGVLLEPLPFVDAGRIVRLFNVYPGAQIPRSNASLPEYLDRRTSAKTLTDLAMYRQESNTIDSATGGQHTFSLRVTASFFPLLGLHAEHGRVIAETDMVPGAPPVVVIGPTLWRSLGGDASVVGSALKLNGTNFTVIGVLPATFRFPSWDAQVLTPIAIRPEDSGLRARHTDGFQMLGRLAPGASVPDAQAEITRLNQTVIAAYPADLHRRVVDAGFATHVRPYLEDMTREVRTPLLVLWAAGLIVLAIAITNVATLLLLRARDRTHELAVRAALGAARYRLGRQLFVESAILVIAGGVLGYLGATAGLQLLAAFEVYEIPRVDGLTAAGVSIGWTAATVAAAMTAIGAITVIASLRDRRDLVGAARVTPAARWPQHLLVGGQMAFAVMLIMTAALLVTSLRNLQAVDPGFDAERVSVAAIILPGQRFPSPESRAEVIGRIITAIEATPGVTRAAAASQLPFSGETGRLPISPDGPSVPGERFGAPFGTTVSDGYFETLGIPVVAGRGLLPADRIGADRVAVIDEILARRYWPDGAVGRQFWGASQPTSAQRPITIVGVVATVSQTSLRDRDQPGAVYLPMAQAPSGFMRIAVKHDGTGDWPSVVRQIATVDVGLVPFWTDTLANSVESSLLFQRGPMQLLSLFAVVGLMLGALGVYGVLGHEFNARRREIAVRLAIGGSRRDILALLARRWFALVAAGALGGLFASLGSTRIVQGLLFDVAATDPRVVAAVIAILLGAAALAALGPIRRAMKVDAASALRQE